MIRFADLRFFFFSDIWESCQWWQKQCKWLSGNVLAYHSTKAIAEQTPKWIITQMTFFAKSYTSQVDASGFLISTSRVFGKPIHAKGLPVLSGSLESQNPTEITERVGRNSGHSRNVADWEFANEWTKANCASHWLQCTVSMEEGAKWVQSMWFRRQRNTSLKEIHLLRCTMCMVTNLPLACLYGIKEIWLRLVAGVWDCDALTNLFTSQQQLRRSC